jgi:tetratricopeptide (TPR) repeat protein
MRCWTRLIEWAEEERASAESYVRLSRAAAWFEDGTAGLWRDPELELGLQWQRKNQPTAAWGERYNPSFDRAIQFLNRSARERDLQAAEMERARKRKLREYQWAASILAVLLLGMGALAYVARKENALAEQNLRLAQSAVDEMLSSAGREQARVAADVPQMEEFRRELLSKAKRFYGIFIREKPDSEALRNETTWAHFRLGDIDRLLQQTKNAADEYRQAIAQFRALANDYPAKPEYRQSLANSYNWLGETLRTDPSARKESADAYDNALRLQTQLHSEHPDNAQYQQELARTHYNRGILRYSLGEVQNSDTDFREAARLLTPLAQNGSDPAAAQELARVYNDRGNLLIHEDRLTDAHELYQQAIAIHENLIKKEAANREYQQELATFRNNFAILLLDQRQTPLAEQQNRRALDLMQELAAPGLSLRMELVHAHNLRCQLLESDNTKQAESECQQSLDLLKTLEQTPSLQGRPEFQRLFRDLGYNYLELAKINVSSGSGSVARSDVEKLRQLLPRIAEPDRTNLIRSYQALQAGSLGKALQK